MGGAGRCPTIPPRMLKNTPDYQDADLVLRLYEMRREPVMRESRRALNQTFWPRSLADVLEVTKSDHPLNAAFRQTGTYWEMVYGLAKHGIAHADYLAENCGEGLYLLARVRPYLEQYRALANPRAFRNAEWMATECETGRQIYQLFEARVARTLAAAK